MNITVGNLLRGPPSVASSKALIPGGFDIGRRSKIDTLPSVSAACVACFGRLRDAIAASCRHG